MQIFNLNDFLRGWFIGPFDNSIIKTEEFEIAIKYYTENQIELPHFHKIATEITIVIDGIIEINNVKYKKNDIIQINPGEISSFKSITNSINAVVKIPGKLGDKYVVSNQ